MHFLRGRADSDRLPTRESTLSTPLHQEVSAFPRPPIYVSAGKLAKDCGALCQDDI